MAKKTSRGAKRASSPLSSKKTTRKYQKPAATKKTGARSKPSAKRKSARVSYKQEYIKLLEKTNKTFAKEIKAIRKAIQPGNNETPESPNFRVTGKGRRSDSEVATINDVVEQINLLQAEISERNRLLEDLMNQDGKK